MDLQDFAKMQEEPASWERIVENCNELISHARTSMWTVLHVMHIKGYHSEVVTYGSGYDFGKEMLITKKLDILSEDDSEIITAKNYPSWHAGHVLASGVDRQENDLLAVKSGLSALANYTILSELRKRKIKRILTIGFQRGVCVLSTALDAVNFDFDSYIVKDCTNDDPLHQSTKRVQMIDLQRAKNFPL